MAYLGTIYWKKKWVRNMLGTYCLNGQEKITSLVPACLFSATLWSHWSRETPIFDQYATKIHSLNILTEWWDPIQHQLKSLVKLCWIYLVWLPGAKWAALSFPLLSKSGGRKYNEILWKNSWVTMKDRNIAHQLLSQAKQTQLGKTKLIYYKLTTD